MSFFVVFSVLARISLILSFIMVAHLPICWLYDSSFYPFISSALICFIIGLALYIGFPSPDREINQREAFMIVALSWVYTCIAGTLPFQFSEQFSQNYGFADALFESISGFTTTGATILTDIEALPKSLLFFRSFTNWLGGMGIVLISIAILPMLGIGGMQLMKAEGPGLKQDKLRPRIIETAGWLWRIYLILTISQTILLYASGLNLFDSINHAFSTVSTGGFSTKNSSIESFNNPFAEWVIILFMILAGMNFSLHFLAYNTNIGSYLKNEEAKVYLLLCLIGAVIFCYFLATVDFNAESSLFDRFRTGAFQCVSLLTGTGFSSANYDIWRSYHKIIPGIMLFIMFTGACSGSTCGGLKIMRLIMLLKNMVLDLKTLTYPRSAIQVTIDHKIVSKEVMRAIVTYTVLYVGVVAISSFIVSFEIEDLWIIVSTVLGTFCNVGPAFGPTGPAGNYFFFSDAMKYFLSFLMLLGRLEIYTIFLLFYPAFWRRF